MYGTNVTFNPIFVGNRWRMVQNNQLLSCSTCNEIGPKSNVAFVNIWATYPSIVHLKPIATFRNLALQKMTQLHKIQRRRWKNLQPPLPSPQQQ